jgi:hypothetical protein
LKMPHTVQTATLALKSLKESKPKKANSTRRKKLPISQL